MRILAAENVHIDIIKGLRQANIEILVETFNREVEKLRSAEPVIMVLSESGYRIHRLTS